MSYKFFNKRFILFPDEDCLGKKVFYADSYRALLEEVESGDSGRVRTIDGAHKDEVYPFNIDGTNWVMAYYDPAYAAKVAYSQGKQIQCKHAEDTYTVWTDVDAPNWCSEHVYRVKPDKYFVHEADTDCYYYDADNTVSILYEGTEEECTAWIAEHAPKTRRFTYRELAKWCADNKGQVKSIDNYVTAYWGYDSGDDEYFVPDGTRIREWGSDEWHEPLVEVAE